MSAAARLKRGLHRAEDLILATALIVLVLLAAAQIGLRTLFDSGTIWLEPLLRTLVLWVAMLGAMIAAREGRHIGLDVFSRVLPRPALRVAHALAFLFAAGVSATLAWQSWRMVLDEYAIGTMAFASVPAWLAQAILPFALAVIALRLAIFALKPPPAPAAAGEAGAALP